MECPQPGMCMCVYRILAQFLIWLFAWACAGLCVCVWECLSDCSLVACFTVPQVMGNWEINGCWADCLFPVQQNASGVNRDYLVIYFYHGALLGPSISQKFLPLRAVYFSCLSLKQQRAKNAISDWNPRATGIMTSTPRLLLRIEATVMIIADNYFPVAPWCFERAEYMKPWHDCNIIPLPICSNGLKQKQRRSRKGT